MLEIKKFHPFHSISYRFREKHLLHKNKFLHLQHNFVRQFKGELVHLIHLRYMIWLFVYFNKKVQKTVEICTNHCKCLKCINCVPF